MCGQGTRRIQFRGKRTRSYGDAARNLARYLALLSEDEMKACHMAFLTATSLANKALAMSVCVICAREVMSYEGGWEVLNECKY
jgi:hypothetical protein